MLCNITQNSMGQTPRGVPISHNTLQHYPEFHGADTWGYPARSSWGGTLLEGTLQGGTQVGYPPPGQDGGYPGRVPPTRSGWGGTLPGGYPVRTTEGVLTTQRVVCLLRSCRRTFLLKTCWKAIGWKFDCNSVSFAGNTTRRNIFKRPPLPPPWRKTLQVFFFCKKSCKIPESNRDSRSMTRGGRGRVGLFAGKGGPNIVYWKTGEKARTYSI